MLAGGLNVLLSFVTVLCKTWQSYDPKPIIFFFYNELMIEYSLHITNGQNYSFININKEYLKETIAPSLNLPSDDET